LNAANKVIKYPFHSIIEITVIFGNNYR